MENYTLKRTAADIGADTLECGPGWNWLHNNLETRVPGNNDENYTFINAPLELEGS